MDELIARLEKAEGPDEVLDGQIWKLCEEKPGDIWELYDGVIWMRRDPNDVVAWETAPRFTESVDAALTLVPEDHRWLIDKRPHADERLDGYRCEVYRQGHPYASDRSDVPSTWGPTPAIALCIAALKARNHAG